MRPDWHGIRVFQMRRWVSEKFLQDNLLARKLCDTGDAHLVEGNSWGDTFWGVDNATGEGENRLGRILMEVRADLQTSTATNGKHKDETHQAERNPRG